ncbi:MAG: MurR/RpiR family transcriptional regulator [Spirochaetales bacterium]|jgi:DNA-binding MurR/RpiR family transcriptional regulator|nr:MurR/RpiR family transcriptional regulator [Spirochaetales bacterium]
MQTDFNGAKKESSETLARISRRFKTLRKSEQSAAQFILAHPERVALLPLRHLAAECGVSEPTILRLCRGLGFSGYQDFKMSLIPQILRGGLGIGSASMKGDALDWRGTVAERAGDTALNSIRGVNGEILAVVAEKVLSARRVITAGLGGAAGVAYILADSLTALGLLCVCSHDPSYLQVLPESLGEGDLIFGISHSGETEEIVRLITRCGEKRAGTVAITNYEKAPLDEAAELTLFTSCNEDLFGSYSPITRISELAVVVALVEQLSKSPGANLL